MLSESKKRRAAGGLAPLCVPDGVHPLPALPVTTPECMSSPVTLLRELTADLEEDRKRPRAAQYLKESRESNLEQRRLYLVLDLDETLVHSVRGSVRQVPSDASSTAEGSSRGGGGSAQAPSLPPAQDEVTLTVQNVEFEMLLRPGVHAFLREMSSLFCVHLYTMGSREYVQQALHHLDPSHEIFKPGQVLAWNPALDRTTKTLHRLLCVPEIVLIVDDSPMAWANHLPNLLLIDRFTGDPDDSSLSRVGEHLKAVHRQYFARAAPPPPRSPPLHTPSLPSPLSLPAAASLGPGSRLLATALSSIPEAGPASSVHQPSSHLAPFPPRSSLPVSRSPLASKPPADSTAIIANDPAAAASADAGDPAAANDADGALQPDAAVAASGLAATRPRSDAADAAAASSSAPVPAPAPAPHSPPHATVPLNPHLPAPAPVDVRQLLTCECEGLLAGVDACFLGGSSMLDDGTPPEVALARRFGATIRPDAGDATTHLLVPPALLSDGRLRRCERTAELLGCAGAVERGTALHLVDARWLLDSVAKWERLEEAAYLIALSCLTDDGEDRP